MSLTLMLLGACCLLLAVCAALLQRNKAQAAKHKAELQKTIVDALQADNDHRRRLDSDLATLEEQQRVETIEQQTHLADRSDFDNDWGSLPSAGAGYVAPNSGATAAEPPRYYED